MNPIFKTEKNLSLSGIKTLISFFYYLIPISFILINTIFIIVLRSDSISWYNIYLSYRIIYLVTLWWIFKYFFDINIFEYFDLIPE